MGISTNLGTEELLGMQVMVWYIAWWSQLRGHWQLKSVAPGSISDDCWFIVNLPLLCLLTAKCVSLVVNTYCVAMVTAILYNYDNHTYLQDFQKGGYMGVWCVFMHAKHARLGESGGVLPQEMFKNQMLLDCF